MLFIYQIGVWLLLQSASPLPSPSQEAIKAAWSLKEGFDSIGSIATPIAAIGLIVALVYFFWHSKNREELTKNNAELSELAKTRLERINDLKTQLAEKDGLIAARDARIIKLEQQIMDQELEDEKRAKTEFRLRAEIADLEKRLGINHDDHSN